MKKTWKIMLCVLLTIAILGGVWMLSARVTSAQIYAALEELPVTNKTSEISAYLDRYFIDDYDEQALADAAASAMVTATGDRWSYYLSAADYQTYEESMNNAYVGIGVTITEDQEAGGLRIESVEADSPAFHAGIEVGDIMLEAEGQKTIEIGTSGTRDLVRGEEGTTVHLKMQRGDEIFELDVLRASIQTQVASCRMLGGNVGYIKINNFDSNCARDTLAAIDALREQGAQSLIFDLRFNPGGMKDELLKVLDYLLPEGPLFTSVDYLGNEYTDYSDENSLDMPMAVLVNGDSYSAAEFFAAALQEYNAATVVGTQTCGKGNYQQTFRLSDGSAVAVSTGHYKTPNGVQLTDVGVTPDIVVEVDEETYLNLYYEKVEKAEDAQLQAAISALAQEKP